MYGMLTLKVSTRLACQTRRTLVTKKVPRLPCSLDRFQTPFTFNTTEQRLMAVSVRCMSHNGHRSVYAFAWNVTERLCLSHDTMNAQMLLCSCLRPDRALCLSDDTIEQRYAVGHVLLCNMTVCLCKARLGNMRQTVQVLLGAVCTGITAGAQCLRMVYQ